VWLSIDAAVLVDGVSQGRTVERVRRLSTHRRLEAVPCVVRQGRVCQPGQPVGLHHDLGAGVELCRARRPRRLDERPAAGGLLSRLACTSRGTRDGKGRTRVGKEREERQVGMGKEEIGGQNGMGCDWRTRKSSEKEEIKEEGEGRKRKETGGALRG